LFVFALVKWPGVGETCAGLVDKDLDFDLRLQFFLSHSLCGALKNVQGIIKEVVGTHVLLRRSLFACDILRRLLRPVSLAKPTSAPLRF